MRYEVKWITGVVLTWTLEIQSGLKAFICAWSLCYNIFNGTVLNSPELLEYVHERLKPLNAWLSQAYVDSILCAYQTLAGSCTMKPLSNFVWATLCVSCHTHIIWCNTMRRPYWGPEEKKMRWGAVGKAVLSSMSMSWTSRGQNKDNKLIDGKKHTLHASLLFMVLIITLPLGQMKSRMEGLCWVIKVADTGTDSLNYQRNSNLIIQANFCTINDTVDPFLICKQQQHEAKGQQLLLITAGEMQPRQHMQSLAAWVKTLWKVQTSSQKWIINHCFCCGLNQCPPAFYLHMQSWIVKDITWRNICLTGAANWGKNKLKHAWKWIEILVFQHLSGSDVNNIYGASRSDE